MAREDDVELVDLLSEGLADSPVELTDSGLKLNLGQLPGAATDPKAQPPTPQQWQAYYEVEAQLRARPSEREPNPSLDRISEVLDLLGSPQQSFAAIQIAGTNGKTSTARMTESLLRAFHRRTGLFSSPALSRLSECIVIDGAEISPVDFVRIYEDIAPMVQLVDSRYEPGLSTFEVLVAMAYAAFADAPVDVAVIETGMGGQWDATNVLSAQVAAITPVGLDHQDFLGDTIAEIAAHKAGIIKPRPRDEDYDPAPAENIAIIAHQEPEALQPLLDQALAVGAAVARQGQHFGLAESAIAVGGQQLAIDGLAGRYDDIFLPLFGEHQAHNAAVALAVVEAFFGAAAGRSLDEETVRTGFAQVTVPGRLERLRANPAVFVDSAHNPHAMASLVAAIERDFDFSELTAVVGVLADKDILPMLVTLEPVVSRIIVTENTSPRAMPVAELEELAQDVFGDDRVYHSDSVLDAIDLALELADEDGAQAFAGKGIIITGSVVTAGQARQLLGG